MSAEFFKRLHKSRTEDDFKKVLKKAKTDDVKAVIELTTKIMSKKIPLSKKYVKIIMDNRHRLRHLVHPKYSIKSKKRYLKQHGGSLTNLLKTGAKMVGSTLKLIPKSPVLQRTSAVTRAAAARSRTAARQTEALTKTVPSGSLTSIHNTPKRLSQMIPSAIDRGAVKIVKGLHYITTPIRYVHKRGKRYIKEHSDPSKKNLSMIAAGGGDVTKVSKMMKDTPGLSELQFSKFQAAGPHTVPIPKSRVQLEHMPGYKLFPEAEGSRVLSSTGRMYEKITRQNVFKLADPGQLKQPLTKTQSAADLPALARDVKGSTQSLFASPETYKK